MEKHGLLLKEFLSREEFQEVRELEQICLSKEEINLKLELDYKQEIGCSNKKDHGMKEFLYYTHGNLTAYLGISEFGGGTTELSGMVHPDWRKRGMFTRLLKHALLEIEEEGQNKVLLLCDKKSEAGDLFIKLRGGKYSFSEYHMKLENLSPIRNSSSDISLRKAELPDADEIRKQDTIFFTDESSSERQEESNTDNDMNDFLKRTYMIQEGNKVIGKIRVDNSEKGAYIYGFGILPQYRKKGYGKEALKQTLNFLYEQGIFHVELDVESKNDAALNLYRSMGFQEVTVMNYYGLKSIEG